MDWNSVGTTLLRGILALGAAAVGTLLTAWLETLYAKTRDEKNGEAAGSLIAKAQDAVTAAVDYVQQTLVDGVKGTEDWTDQAKSDAFDTAEAMVAEILGAEGMTGLEKLYGSLESWLRAKIEQAVLKRRSAASGK